MQESTIPLELLTTGSSILVVFLILYTILKYKKKIAFIQHLLEEKENGNFTSKDQEFFKITYNETCHLRNKIFGLTKLLYPVFILISGVFFIFFELTQALTHMNIVVVTFLYLYILRTNVNSYIRQMDLLA